MDELRKQLKVTLATVFAFYLKVHHCHWNVEGPDFFEYHKMLEEIYQDVYDSVDELAEKIRTVGAYAPGGLKKYASLSEVEDDVEDAIAASVMIETLLADNAIVIETLNGSFRLAQKQNLQGLMNYLADRIDKHQKWGWFLRATSKKRG